MTPIALDHPPKAELGEGPCWDAETGLLYWVDISGHRLHRFDPASGRCDTHHAETFVTFVVLDRRGGLIVGLGGAIHAMQFGAPGTRAVFEPAMHAENRFNDGKCDPRGRLWAGTMHREASRDREATGALYRVGDHGLERVEQDIGISNGLGWNAAGTRMYHADTFRGIVWVYDYDLETGGVANRRVFAEVPIDLGVPDGLSVDSQGRVLVAIWRGARINIYGPAGDLVDAIPLPVPCPTSCCFGGADLQTLYITTAQSQSNPTETDTAGCLFQCRLDIPGIAATRMDI